MNTQFVASLRPPFTKSFLGRVTASLFALTLATLMFSPMNDIVRVPVHYTYVRVVTGFNRMVGRPDDAPTVFDREMAMGRHALLDRWDPLIADASQRFAVPADWIRAVMHVESGGRTVLHDDRPITSHAGAVGIMQVMPGTYAQMRKQYRLGADPYNPHDNVYAGAAYLRWLHRRYGYPNMFAAYNGGPGKLEAYLRGDAQLPKETQHYLANVTNIVASAESSGHKARHTRRYARLALAGESG